MNACGTAVREGAERPGSSNRRHEKSKLRMLRKGKSSDKKSLRMKRKMMKKKMMLKMKMKMKMKKRSSTHSNPDPDPDPRQEQEREQTNRNSESQPSEPPRPKFSEHFFGDYSFNFRPYGEPLVGRGGRPMAYIVAHVAAGEEAQNSKCYQLFTKFAIDEFNKSNNANLELARIESVNKRVHVGFVYFLRFVAKNLNTGYTGFYRAAVHLFFSTLTLVHFKDEELEWRG